MLSYNSSWCDQEERKELQEKAKEATDAAKQAALAKAQEVKVIATQKLHEKAAETKEQQAERVRILCLCLCLRGILKCIK